MYEIYLKFILTQMHVNSTKIDIEVNIKKLQKHKMDHYIKELNIKNTFVTITIPHLHKI